MNHVGKVRLKIYELLYSKPICQYAEKGEGGRELNVLILGNGWAGNEAFKASFWAGQSIDSTLNITVASQNALELRDIVMSEGDDAVLPSLGRFACDKKYANIRFAEFDWTDDKSCWNSLELDKNKYNYIIVALGDKDVNHLVGDALCEQIAKVKRDGVLSYSGKIIINIFDEFTDEANTEDPMSLVDKEPDMEINLFGNDAAVEENELKRLAKNLNFAYEQKYNQRISKTVADERFETSFQREFMDAPVEYETGNLGIVSNFIGGVYYADSSYASAVHIASKLEICKEYGEKEHGELTPIQVLSKAVCEKNELYKELVVLEHRRWNAYMVMRGYRAPTESEEKKYLFQTSKDGSFVYHRFDGLSKEGKALHLHMCLCDCDKNAKELDTNFGKGYRAWLNQDYQTGCCSELMQVSYKCHERLCLQSQNYKGNIRKKIQDINEMEKGIASGIGYMPYDYDKKIELIKSIENLLRCVEKVLNDETNAAVVYEKALDRLQMNMNMFRKKFNFSTFEKELLDIDRQLTVFKRRNRRMNFLTLDAQLIDMLPFVTWYNKDRKTVLVISKGNAYEDIIAPTLLNSENAIFYKTEQENWDDEKYKKIVEEYFIGRGNNTKLLFPSSVLPKDSEAIFEKLDKLHKTVIYISNSINVDVAFAVVEVISKLGKPVDVVTWNPKRGLVTICGDAYLSAGLNNKSLTAGEFIALAGGRVMNESDPLYDTTQYGKLCSLFAEFSNMICIRNENEDYKRSVWGIMSSYIADQCERAGDSESFFVNVNLGDKKLLGFKPCDGGIDANIENKSFQTVVAKFLESLKNKKLIENLKELNLAKTQYSFRFKDQATLQLFSKAGNLFELVVYTKVRGCGLFDDIENGVNFFWDDNRFTMGNAGNSVTNEIDIIAIKGMVPLFISCKNYESKEENNQWITRKPWIYEISTITSKLNCLGAMAVSYGVTEQAGNSEKGRMGQPERAQFERAIRMGISFISKEAIWNEKELEEALAKIINGKTYIYKYKEIN